MRVLDSSEVGIYRAADDAQERIVLLRDANDGWWAVVRVDGVDHDLTSVETAFLMDPAERADKAVIAWATKARQRAAHPENE